MHPGLLIPLLIPLGACLLSAALAGATLSRDPGLKANRLMAAILAAAGTWSFAEVVWNLMEDRQAALLVMRLSSLGWISLGPLCLHLSVELLADPRSRARRFVRPAYAFAAAVIALYATTPLFLADAVRTGWGWGYVFGPLFPLAYLTAAGPPFLLVALWRHLHPADASRAERHQWNAAFAGVALVLAVASLTDVALPWWGLEGPRLGGAAVAVLGVTLALMLQRYGYLMLSPGAFAPGILGALRDGVAVIDGEGRIAYGNEALGGLASCPAPALRGVEVARLIPGLPARPLRGERTMLQPARGDAVPVQVSSVDLPGQRRAGACRALVVVDLREVRALRQRLRTRARLAAVGELAGGLAREIQEPIAFVRECLTALRRDWAELAERLRKAERAEALEEVLAEGRELVDESEAGVDRVMALLDHVDGLTPEGAAPSEPVDLNALVRRSLRVALAQGPRHLRVEEALAPLPRVRCAPREMEQVLLNLLTNALHAVEEGGRVRVASARVGDVVRLEVEDSGAGIPDAILDRIFDPFFTTKPVGQGTGLGLAISYHIVRRHGGDLRVASQPGVGSTFTVELPVAATEGRRGRRAAERS